MSQIADFFVKLGFKVDNPEVLNAVTKQLQEAAKAAKDLGSSLGDVQKKLTSLANIEIKKPEVLENKEVEAGKQKDSHVQRYKYEKELRDKDFREKEKQAKAEEDFRKRMQKAYDKEEAAKKKAYEQNVKSFNKINQGKTDVNDLAIAFSELGIEALSAGAVIAGAVIALDKISSSTISTGNNLKNFSLSTGLSTDTLQSWQLEAIKVGSSADEMAATIARLQQIMTDVATNRASNPWFSQLGIDPREDVYTAFNKISKALRQSSGINAPIAFKAAQGLGIQDPNIYAAIRAGKFNPSEQESAARYTDEEINKLKEINSIWGDINLQAKLLSTTIGKDLVVPLTNFANVVDKILKGINELYPIFKSSVKIGMGLDFSELNKLPNPDTLFTIPASYPKLAQAQQQLINLTVNQTNHGGDGKAAGEKFIDVVKTFWNTELAGLAAQSSLASSQY